MKIMVSLLFIPLVYSALGTTFDPTVPSTGEYSASGHDLVYDLVSEPTGATYSELGSAELYQATGAWADPDAFIPGAWIIPPWNHNLGAETTVDRDGGVFRFESAFNLGDFYEDTVSINANVGFDNDGMIAFNGGQGATPVYNAWHDSYSSLSTVSLNSGLTRGWNTIELTVTNTYTSPVGVLFQVTGTEGKPRPDLIWYNSGSYIDVNFWYCDSANYIGSGYLPYETNLNWKIVGANDFNNDGYLDLLWRNTSNGSNRVWFPVPAFVEDNVSATSQNIEGLSDTSWNIKGTGDLDGDGYADVVWEKSNTGDLKYWRMSGTSKIQELTIDRHSLSTNYTIKAVGDLNGDGKADLIWRNVSTGANEIWLMNSNTRSSVVSLTPSVTDSNWDIKGVVDFDNDGQLDILWRHATLGYNHVWVMNGTSYVSSITSLPPVTAASGWQLVGPK